MTSGPPHPVVLGQPIGTLWSYIRARPIAKSPPCRPHASVSLLQVPAGGPVVAVLSSAIAVKLGRISYGTYLWHWPLIIYVRQLLELSSIALFVVAAIGASALASLSFWLMESPIRTSRRLGRWPRGVVASGLGASVVAALFVFVPVPRPRC